MQIEKEALGGFQLYRLTNASGASVDLVDYGCRIRSLRVPDREGTLRDVVYGQADEAEYRKDTSSVGAVVGRVANRIKEGKLHFNGKDYQLAINNGPNNLHGGPTGFGQRVFAAEENAEGLTFARVAPDGEENFPGELTVRVTYQWSDDNALTIGYAATAKGDTVVNLTNHAYFNLNGFGSGTVLDHVLRIGADRLAPNDENQIPTGEFLDVAGTPFDFRAGKPIGQDIKAPHPQLAAVNNTYDHCFALNGEGFREVAELYAPESGIRMTCETDQPALQLYVNDFQFPTVMKEGKRLDAFCACCLETQHFPDSMNRPEFPSIVLKDGETFRSKTVYRFSVK